jgi:hypothetical protein
MLESEIAQKILLKLGKDPDVLLLRRNVGLFYTKNGNPINIGFTGEADYQGMIDGQKCPHCNNPIHPLPIALETKSKKGKQSEDQKKFQAETWERRGGVYLLANDIRKDYRAEFELEAKLRAFGLK